MAVHAGGLSSVLDPVSCVLLHRWCLQQASVCLSLRSDLALWLRLSTCVAVLIYLCFAYICKCYAVACAGYAAMVSQCCPLVLLK